MADWVDNYHDYDEAAGSAASFLREKIREESFARQIVEAAPRPAPSSSGQDTGLSRRRHGFNPRRGHRRTQRR